jgi:hypothetical protein
MNNTIIAIRKVCIQAITELVENGCAYEVPFKPFAVNPLSVAINKSEKNHCFS